MYKILFELGDRHDATIYYVDIIKDAISCNGANQIEIVDSIDMINRDDVVVVVNAKATVRILLKNRKQKIICWYQGIMPEEIKVFYIGWTKYLRILLWNFLEIISLRKNVFSIFVSERMQKHYQDKYKLEFKKGYYIMPCFNQTIQRESFLISDKYTTPTFLYAGTLSKWQCIEEMLELYKKIEDNIPNTTLFLYTAEQDKAREMVNKYLLKRVHIAYVPFNQLNNEIKKCKYGFLIREDIEMNRVSTPTKMNSYLANGIIPIYTDCIDSFRKNLDHLRYQILLNEKDLISQILNFEQLQINPIDVFEEYGKTIFSNYYSRNSHILKLQEKLHNENII